ncbi:MAG: serine hydrolase domain-containing protein, partial [Bacteroidota bacterium]
MILHRVIIIIGLLILPTTQKLLAINTAKSFVDTNPFTQIADDTLAILGAHLILESRLDSIVINYDMMGGILVLGCQESEPEFFPLGVSDYMSQDAITPQTPFRIASISKMITALGVMKLVQEDAIDLDAPLEVYFGYPIRNPNYPDEPITTRQLLSHQSSIRDGEAYNRFLSVSYSSAEPPSLRSLITPDGTYYSEALFGSEAPGGWFQYSNLNYGILGTLVEAVSNQAFDVFMKEHVFLPLGLQAGFSSYTRNYDQWPATLYRKPGGVWKVQADGRPSEGTPQDGEKYPSKRDNVSIGINAIPYGPQGSLRISAEDLMRILLAMQKALSSGYSPENWLHTQTIEDMVGIQWSADPDQG